MSEYIPNPALQRQCRQAQLPRQSREPDTAACAPAATLEGVVPPVAAPVIPDMQHLPVALPHGKVLVARGRCDAIPGPQGLNPVQAAGGARLPAGAVRRLGLGGARTQCLNL